MKKFLYFYFFIILLALMVIMIPGLRPVYAYNKALDAINWFDHVELQHQLSQTGVFGIIQEVKPNELTIKVTQVPIDGNKELIGKEITAKTDEDTQIQVGEDVLPKQDVPFDLTTKLKKGMEIDAHVISGYAFTLYWKDETDQQNDQQKEIKEQNDLESKTENQIQPSKEAGKEDQTVTARPGVIFLIESNKYQLGDQIKDMDAKPYISKDGRTYVPVRYMSEPFGIKVQWDKNLNLVTLSRDETRAYLVVGVKKILVKNSGDDSSKEGITAKVKSEGREIDAPPVIQDGRTYLPAKWVAEAFGYKVEWDSKAQTVAILPPGAQKPEVKLPPVVKPVVTTPVANSPFKRPDIVFPHKPRAMVMGFKPNSKKVVFWNYDPADVIHGSSGDYYVTVDDQPPRRWEETLPDYLTPEPVNQYDEGLINIKVLLTAFGVPEEAIQFDSKSKTLRVYGTEGYWSPAYVEIKEGSSNLKMVWEKGGKTINEDLGCKLYVKNGKYLIDDPNIILMSAFNWNGLPSTCRHPDTIYENMYTAGFITV